MRDYAELVKALRHCIITIPCDGCPYYSNGDAPTKECSTMNFAAADAIDELLEWKRLLESKNNLQAKIIKHMETVMKVNGLPTPPKEET